MITNLTGKQAKKCDNVSRKKENDIEKEK